MPAEVVVVGQVARDLVLRVGAPPRAGESAAVRSRREVLGGKGANQAVGFAQLGMSVALVGAVGEDRSGEEILSQAGADGVDTTWVAHRDGAETALIVDVVDDDGQWRYLEHIPDDAHATTNDVSTASAAIAAADAVVLQLQQPIAAVLEAARAAHSVGGSVILDGVPEDGGDDDTSALFARTDVLRADARESAYLAGKTLSGVDEAVHAGRELIERGPSLAVLEIAGEGNVFVSATDYQFLPLLDTEVVDTTGAGDALVAALTSARLRGWQTGDAARFAVAAAGATVGHAGGRPDLAPDELEQSARRLD